MAYLRGGVRGVGSGGRQQMFFVATDSKLKRALSGLDPAIGWRRVSGDKSGVKLNISPSPTIWNWCICVSEILCLPIRMLSDRGHEVRELEDLAAKRSNDRRCGLICNLFFFCCDWNI